MHLLIFQVVADFTKKFKTLSHPLTPKVPLINILMIGETGAGKSSFLNTFASALSGKIEEIYRISPTGGTEISATQRVQYFNFVTRTRGSNFQISLVFGMI